METKIIQHDKNILHFEITDLNHTELNVLKDKLSTYSDVIAVSYNVPHPLINKATFVLQTKKDDPQKLISKAVKDLIKDYNDLDKQISKL